MPEKVAILISNELRRDIFDDATWEDLLRVAEPVLPSADGPVTAQMARNLLRGARACITGWGSPALTADVLAEAELLGLVAHAAGSVKAFVSDALWERGVRVTSAAPALAVDVAWTTVALMVLARKNVFLLREHLRQGGWKPMPGWPSSELYGAVIGLVGASHVGRCVIRLLENSGARLLLYDPYVSGEEAARLGVEKREALDQLIAESDIVSLHAPKLPETHHMLNAGNLHLMKDHSILINTARGALIDEAALIELLRTRPIFACLDVTDPEPPAPDSPLRTLPNVLLTPHVAGCVGSGLKRLGAAAAEEVRRFLAGEPLLNEVTREMLPRLA
ncbi:MAG: dehydrogenase [Armatimonadota bacterium]|nr:MAG: dehydrogenase [Armatimonadota bacterium]